ncbi:MAG: hypothetical protein HY921_00320 [Elusimicrobia bacterium]|nr:hypothetical protein [Elusimicrobiota bacterium]
MPGDSQLVSELRATLGKLEVALGAINDAIVWVNESGKIQWGNKPFNALIKRASLEALGKDLVNLLPLRRGGKAVPPDSHPAHLALKSPSSVSQDFEFQQDSETLSLEVFAAQVRLEEGGGERGLGPA